MLDSFFFTKIERPDHVSQLNAVFKLFQFSKLFIILHYSYFCKVYIIDWNTPAYIYSNINLVTTLKAYNYYKNVYNNIMASLNLKFESNNMVNAMNLKNVCAQFFKMQLILHYTVYL